MKIIDLTKYMVLEEMATNNFNKRIDNKFYDNFAFKDTKWLVDNMDKIIDDFYSKDNTFEREHGYYTVFNRFQTPNNLEGERDFITGYLRNLKKEEK